jgi:hypothetical protein
MEHFDQICTLLAENEGISLNTDILETGTSTHPSSQHHSLPPAKRAAISAKSAANTSLVGLDSNDDSINVVPSPTTFSHTI